MQLVLHTPPEHTAAATADVATSLTAVRVSARVRATLSRCSAARGTAGDWTADASAHAQPAGQASSQCCRPAIKAACLKIT